MFASEAPVINSMDRNCLRDLARRVAEVAHLPEQNERADEWRRHNDLERVRPMVLVFPEGSWREFLPATSLTTTSPQARAFEMDLRQRLYYHDHLRDDNVIEAVMPSPIVVRNTGWGCSSRTPPRTVSREPTISSRSFCPRRTSQNSGHRK